MLPSICCCCGVFINRRAPDNPNLCLSCGVLDEEKLRNPELPSGCAVPDSPPEPPQAPTELEHLLEIEGPTVIECFDAVEQARQAIAEAAAHEQSQPAPQLPPRPAPAQ